VVVVINGEEDKVKDRSMGGLGMDGFGVKTEKNIYPVKKIFFLEVMVFIGYLYIVLLCFYCDLELGNGWVGRGVFVFLYIDIILTYILYTVVRNPPQPPNG
jgi:hypothetical protein